MASSADRQQTFPAAPPSFSAGDQEMRDYYAFQNATRPPPNQAPYLTPYLGLRARLSQVWINRWTILLLLVLVRTLLAIGSLNNGLASARTQALSACTSVEDVGSNMASMPHYMAQGVNRLTADGVTKAVSGLMDMVTLSITGVEEIVVFVIGMMTNTYLCLFTMAATGGAHLALAMLQEFSSSINNTLSTIEDDLTSGVASLQKDINKFVSLLKGVPSVSGSAPTVDFTSEIDALKNITLPGDINQKISQLNSSIPSFDQVKSALDDLIRLPFEDLKQLINSTFGNYTFDHTLLPVPQKESLEFCSDNNGINDFFDSLVHIAHIARNIFLAVLLTSAILVCLPMAWMEMMRWRRLQQRSVIIGREAVDPLDGMYMASRPFTSNVGLWMASKSSTPRHQLIIRWTIAYCTSIPALFLLSLALAGLFACLCQYLLLRSIEKEVPSLAAEVGDFAADVVNKLNNASAFWANGTNALLGGENNKINTDLLSWVNTSTVAVNNTLNEFVNQTTALIQKSFGDTILADALQDVFNCLIGLKVLGLEKGLTWVHDNANVNFPLLPNDTFTLQNLASHTDSTSDDNFLANPQSTTTDEVSGAIESLVNKLMWAVRQEAIIATIILCLWLVVALMGFGRACWLFLRHDKMRAEGGHEYPPSNDYPSGKPTLEPSVFAISSYEPKNVEAPSYEAAMSDVNPHAPYTLAPHPFPRADGPSPQEEAQLEKGKPRTDVRNYTQTVEPKSAAAHKSMHGAIVNEKNGVDPFADYRPDMI